MFLYLFSNAGDSGANSVLEACRPYLLKATDPVLLYLPPTMDRDWYEFTRDVFSGLAAVVAPRLEALSDAEFTHALDMATVVYMPGGSTFALQRRLSRNGFMELLRKKIKTGLPFVGFSAGTVMAGANLRTSNDPLPVGQTDFTSLALVQYNFNVHYPLEESEHAVRDVFLQACLTQDPHPILALADGAYLRSKEEKLELVRGDCCLLEPGELKRKIEPGQYF